MLSSGLFTTFIALEKRLHSLLTQAVIDLDVSNAKFIDHTFMEKLHELREEVTLKCGQLHVYGLERLKSQSEHPHAARRLMTSN